MFRTFIHRIHINQRHFTTIITLFADPLFPNFTNPTPHHFCLETISTRAYHTPQPRARTAFHRARPIECITFRLLSLSHKVSTPRHHHTAHFISLALDFRGPTSKLLYTPEIPALSLASYLKPHTRRAFDKSRRRLARKRRVVNLACTCDIDYREQSVRENLHLFVCFSSPPPCGGVRVAQEELRLCGRARDLGLRYGNCVCVSERVVVIGSDDCAKTISRRLIFAGD